MPVTETNRYLTCGVDNAIPLELQLFLWDCVDRLPEPKDYLQVFELKPSGSMQSITHIRRTRIPHGVPYTVRYSDN